jgi:hypothetical protein
MSTPSIENLELRALEQRNRLHKSAGQLRAKVQAGRERLRVSKKAREHFLGASVLLSVLGFGLGYGFGGMFTPS